MMPECKHRQRSYWGDNVCVHPDRFAGDGERLMYGKMMLCEVLGDIKERCPLVKMKRLAAEMEEPTIFGDGK